MSRIEQLIAELCPDGVEFKELGEVGNLFIGSFVKKTEQNDNYEWPVYNGGISPTGYYNNFNSNKNSVVLSARGANCGFVNYLTVDFWAGNSCYVIKDLSYDVNSKFLFHYLKCNEINLYGLRQTSGIPAINSAPLKKFNIPIPPIPIQQEIVRILDTFTDLDAELQAELEARKKQYEHYRNQLLNFEGKEVEWKTLGEVCKYIVSGGTPSTNRSEYYGGDIPWLRTQEIDWNDIYDTGIKISELGLNNSSAKWIKPNCVIVAMYGATAAKVAVNKIPLTTNQACCNLEINDAIANYRFVYHWICKEYENLKSLGEGVQSNINSQKIRRYNIPIPPLPEQERIVSILDKFEALVNDELPAEIAARRKQYEYYREKLLTFEPLIS